MSRTPQFSIWVRVPGTVGNFAGAGCGAALALDCPMNVQVMAREDHRVLVRYFGEDGHRIPRDSSNLIVQSMRACLSSCGRPFTGAGLEIYNSIPPGVGLGASVAAIWAGAIAANALYDLGLDLKELTAVVESLDRAKANIHAAWFGGLAALTATSGGYRTALVPKDFKLAVLIPSVASHSVARAVPRSEPDDAAEAFRRATNAASFLAQGGRRGGFSCESEVPGHLAAAVPGLEDALQISIPGLLGAFVCGSGPAVGVLAEDNNAEAVDAIRECFSRRGVETRKIEFHSSSTGARDWNSRFAAAVPSGETQELWMVAAAGQPA
jgi:homoserine kinase